MSQRGWVCGVNGHRGWVCAVHGHRMVWFVLYMGTERLGCDVQKEGAGAGWAERSTPAMPAAPTLLPQHIASLCVLFRNY